MEMGIEKKTIAVLGFGNFGKVVCNFLFPKNNIRIFSPNIGSYQIPTNCITCSTVENAVRDAGIVIPAVPIRKFETVCKEIVKYIPSKTIVMDVCSVKEYPVKIMQQVFPKNPILATHPMFGPNSLSKNNNILDNLKMVLCNVSLQDDVFDELKNYFSNKKLQLLELSPKMHDELSAKSQFFSLVTAQVAQELQLKPTQIDTPGAEQIFKALEYMGQDKQIIEDMIAYNRYCKSLAIDMINIIEDLGGKND